MKKFSKVLALSLVAVLVFGMTVFAAGSSNTGDQNKPTQAPATEAPATQAPATEAPATQAPTTKPTQTPTQTPTQAPVAGDFAVTEDGLVLNWTLLSAEETAIVNNYVGGIAGNEELANKVLSVLGLTGRKIIGCTAVSAFDLSAPANWDGTPVTVNFTISNLDPNGTYVALHYLNGINEDPEILPAIVKNGKIAVTFSSFSPVVIVKVNTELIETGEEGGNNGGSNNSGSNNSSNNGAPESPKTGEVLPVAGILAVICMAGAALCAAKARYNK